MIGFSTYHWLDFDFEHRLQL